MKIETVINDQQHAKITAEFDAAFIDQFKQRAARQLSKRIKLPGFRPGKAPLPVIMRQVGEAAILEEAIELLVKDHYGKVIDEAGIKPYGPGSLENIENTDPLTLVFDVPLQAETELGDYKAIRKPYEPREIKEEEIEKVFDDLRERQAVVEPVDRAVIEGDMVGVKISGKKAGAEENDEDLIPERTQVIMVSKEKEASDETDYEWPFPGFSRNLIGMSTGESKEITHTFAENSPYQNLRNAEAQLVFSIDEVKSRTLPELDDEFAKSVGEYDDLSSLRKAVADDLAHQAEHEYHDNYDEEVLSELVETSTFKYAPEMLEDEVEQVINNLRSRLAQINYDFDLYMKSRQMDLDGLKEEARPVAEKNLKKNLVLVEVAKAENIQVSSDELQEEATRTLGMMSQNMPKNEMQKLNDRNVFNNFVSGVMADMITARSMERLRLIASDRYVEETGQGEEPEAQTPESDPAEADAAMVEPAEVEQPGDASETNQE